MDILVWSHLQFSHLPNLIEWKSKSEECANEIREWTKKGSAVTSNLSKLTRLINSKVLQHFLSEFFFSERFSFNSKEDVMT